MINNNSKNENGKIARTQLLKDDIVSCVAAVLAGTVIGALVLGALGCFVAIVCNSEYVFEVTKIFAVVGGVFSFVFSNAMCDFLSESRATEDKESQ